MHGDQETLARAPLRAPVRGTRAGAARIRRPEAHWASDEAYRSPCTGRYTRD
jgi:hypothetical protein